MTDPDDKTLLRFVAEFAGWREIQTYGDRPELCGRHDDWQEVELIPDFLGSVDIWLNDVWPKVLERSEHGHRLARDWQECIRRIYLDNTTTKSCYSYEIYNASARDRCLALHRALAGKLPDPTTGGQ